MKKLLLFPIHLGSFRKGGLGYLVLLHQILFHGFDLILLQAENLVVDGLQTKIPIFSEVPVGQGRQQALDITDGQNIFKIINENQEQHVLSGILLFLGRWKQTVLGVVVDHRLGQNLIILVTLGCFQLTVHKGGHLIHIKVNAGHVLRPDIIDSIQAFQNTLQKILTVDCHKNHLKSYYIVLKTI